ncbi:MAG TPA: ABC transporter permease [Bryobacteraceae bacterium]
MFTQGGRDREFNEEIQTHLQIEADRLVQEGMPPQEALAAARRAFGNATSARERFYESRRWMPLDHLARDVRYALRQLRHAPVSTATVIFSLALGIGVNTAIFSLADQALLRALPVEKPQQLVLLNWHGSFVGGGVGSDNLLPHPFFRELRKENDVFVDMFARFPTDVHLSTGARSQPVGAEIVSGSYFPTLGVRPRLGRLLGDSDDLQPGAHPVVVLSYDYWRNHLGSDPAIVGKRVLINDFPMTVVGVAERGFHGVDVAAAPALWIPIMMKRQATPGWDALNDRRTSWLHVFGRLKPGITARQAQARLQPWFKAYLRADTRREGWPQVTPAQMRDYLASRLNLLPAAEGRSDLRGMIREPLLILLAATGLILLLACLNVANLSLAKVLARRRSTALRAALGAGRSRILIEQLIESGLLAAAGCLAGLLLAPLVGSAILSFLPQGLDGVALTASLDPRVLLFALAITALTTLLCGVAPAFYATSIQPVTALKEQSSAVTRGFGLRKALVIGQFSLALILLIGAGLFARTLSNLRLQGPGFPTTNLLMFRIDPLADGYKAPETKPLVRQVLAAVQALPEVAQAGAAGLEMLTGGGWNNPVTVQSNRRIVTEDIPMNSASPGFFETLGARIMQGRDFNERDAHYGADGDRRSAIVNEEFVKRYLKDSNPIGAGLGIGNAPNTVANIEIVGVVKSFSDFFLRKPEPEVFFALWEGGVGGAAFYVRARTAAPVAMRSIRAALTRIDPKLSVLALRSIDDQLDRMLASERMLATLAAGFAVLATLLAMIGLYGVLSFSAESRTKEIGIRLALGAPRGAAGGLIVREAALLALAGLAIALPISWALGRLIESQLFGVHPMDTMTITGAALVLALVCLAASAVPARRAESVSPLEALRSE